MSDINMVKIEGKISSTNDISIGAVSTMENVQGGVLPFSYQSVKLNPATRERIGGVIIGDNVLVTEDGTISVESPEYMDNFEFLQLFD